jgi:DNA-binding transcriptional ArsR family regulator
MHADTGVDQPLADQIDDQLVELAVEIFTMLADATRVRIVLALKHGELPVNTLADVVGKYQPRHHHRTPSEGDR